MTSTTHLSNILIPKMAYRFRVIFKNVEGNDNFELTRQVTACERPKCNVDVITNAVTWRPIVVTLYDDATNIVTNIVQSHMLKQMNSNARFDVHIEQLSSDNDILEKWDLTNCYFNSVDFGDLSCDSNRAIYINLSVAFKQAKQICFDSPVTN